jgi:hypothetical protein
MNDLIARLLAHADLHEALADTEQQQWAADLREAALVLGGMDILATYSGNGDRQWHSVGAWLTFGDAIATVSVGVKP